MVLVKHCPKPVATIRGLWYHSLFSLWLFWASLVGNGPVLVVLASSTDTDNTLAQLFQAFRLRHPGLQVTAPIRVVRIEHLSIQLFGSDTHGDEEWISCAPSHCPPPTSIQPGVSIRSSWDDTTNEPPDQPHAPTYHVWQPDEDTGVCHWTRFHNTTTTTAEHLHQRQDVICTVRDKILRKVVVQTKSIRGTPNNNLAPLSTQSVQVEICFPLEWGVTFGCVSQDDMDPSYYDELQVHHFDWDDGLQPPLHDEEEEENESVSLPPPHRHLLRKQSQRRRTRTNRTRNTSINNVTTVRPAWSLHWNSNARRRVSQQVAGAGLTACDDMHVLSVGILTDSLFCHHSYHQQESLQSSTTDGTEPDATAVRRAATAAAIDLVEQANLFFFHNACIHLELDLLELHCNATTDPFTSLNQPKCSQFLLQVARRHARGPLNQGLDNVQLLHGLVHSSQTSTVGCAYIGGLCQVPWSVGVTRATRSYMSTIKILAHELGHNLGALHASSQQDVMYRKILASTNQQFLPDTVQTFQTKLEECIESVAVTPAPTVSPAPSQSAQPSSQPSPVPTVSNAPSATPSRQPSTRPTSSPTTSFVPSHQPSPIPTVSTAPSEPPTTSQIPSTTPSTEPSSVPSAQPTMFPTSTAPTSAPTHTPSTAPTTSVPTGVPTNSPTTDPTTATPSQDPTTTTTRVPSMSPTTPLPSAATGPLTSVPTPNSSIQTTKTTVPPTTTTTTTWTGTNQPTPALPTSSTTTAPTIQWTTPTPTTWPTVAATTPTVSPTCRSNTALPTETFTTSMPTLQPSTPNTSSPTETGET